MRLANDPIRSLLLVLALLWASAVSAQGYPDKGRVIKIIVPSGPGSALDSLARAYGKAMSEGDGFNVIVENKPGAEGVPGVQSFLAAPADGYTMLLVSSSMLTLNPVMMPKLPYDPLKDLTPLITTSKAPLVMSLGSGTNFKTLREFVAAARANPGKYTCATSTSTLRMACEFLQASAGIKLLLVPYKTTAAAMIALASGEADVVFVDAGSVIGQWKTGRIRGVAALAPERLPALPDLPTTREQGLPDLLMSAWYATYFRAGTPPPMAAAMRDILRKAAATPTVKEALNNFVHQPLELAGDDVTAMNRREIDVWQRLVREHSIAISGN
jgi:tripartite-type tricarboxylate transporter receptor subunit TctC